MFNNNISLNFDHLICRIREAEEKYSRPPGSVSVLAVSKGQSIDLIKLLVKEGQTAFGENYVQEALPKIAALHQPTLTWHYIGRIQSRKIPLMASHFDWIHTLSRVVEAEALSHFLAPHSSSINVCIQVKLDNNPLKSGIDPGELLPLAYKIISLPHLRLRGLMTIAPPLEPFSLQRQFFSKLRALFTVLQEEGIPVDTLSMGMTHDFEAAIAEGATCVRIGTGLFGPRTV